MELSSKMDTITEFSSRTTLMKVVLRLSSANLEQLILSVLSLIVTLDEAKVLDLSKCQKIQKHRQLLKP